MTKKTPETLLAILDTLAGGNVVYSDAAKVNGVQPNTFWHWMRASQLNRDPDLVVPYLGELMPFHVAVEAARQIALCDTRARIEKRTMVYQGEPVFFKDIPPGEPVAEPVADIDLDDLLGPVPDDPVAEPVAEVVPDEPVAEVVPDEPAPKVVPDNRASPQAERPTGPLAFDQETDRVARSPLEADLLARLAAARAKNAPPLPSETGQTQGPSRAA